MIINGMDLLDAGPIENMLTKLKYNGVSHGLGEAGYDIRIKQDIQFWPGLTGRVIVKEDGKEITSSDGHFTLASAIEEFHVPSTLCGIVHDKSTWARQGLSVFNTVIEPGWKGFLTLELVYHGHTPLHIPAGSGIAQVIFHQVSSPAQYDGKYQNQGDGITRPIFA